MSHMSLLTTDSASPIQDQTIQQFVAFRSAGAQYGAEIMAVQEIRSWQPTAALPNRHPAGRGVLDIRGKVVEVFDLSLMLGGPALVPDKGSVILVICMPKSTIGLLVESVSDIIQVDTATIMPVPDNHVVNEERVSGMVSHQGDLVGLLDLSALISVH